MYHLQAAQAGQTIIASQTGTTATVTPVLTATGIQKTVAVTTPLITSVTQSVTPAARIQVCVNFVLSLYSSKS